MKRVIVIFGTRPEAIKMAPVVHALREDRRFDVRVIVTAQHRQMLDQVLTWFDIRPDVDLDLMRQRQTSASLTALAIERLEPIVRESGASIALVHGDTTTTLAASLACFYAGVAVGHVEAGLRSGDLRDPWPEEMNRRVVSTLAALHFAPTARAVENLRREDVPEDRIEMTGNTVIDALQFTAARLEASPPVLELPQDNRRLILVTAHRRDNLGKGIESICVALRRLAARGDVRIVYPVHLNPAVREPVHRLLGGLDAVHLIEPVDYLTMVHLMKRSHLILTDSGGIQEEAPTLGKPVLVMRKVTERPEAIESGAAALVGAESDAIVEFATRLLDDPSAYARMARVENPFGDGQAARRIADRLGR